MPYNYIHEQTLALRQNFHKKYKITLTGFYKFSNLKPRAQILLLDMVRTIGTDNSIDCLLVKGSYRDFGFGNYPNFLKYKTELIDSGFIEQVDGGYYVNPNLIIYYSNKQKNFFYTLFGIAKEVWINFGIPKK